MSYENFYKEFLQDIYARSEAERDFSEVIFTEKICDFLVDQAVLENYTTTSFKKKSQGIRVDAYDISEESGFLSLIVTDFNNAPDTLTLTSIKTITKRVEKFFEKCLDDQFYKSLEESDPGFKLAREIHLISSKLRKVRFIVISTSLLSKRISEIPEEFINGITTYVDIWDLGRIQRIEESGKAREDIIVRFDKYPDGIPCLPAFTGENTFESYLIVMPGSLVAELYDNYGERLLEQNVRTFLQFRGNVNKGIRNTIINEPEMFFAYNNGISATAEEVDAEIKEKSVVIKSIKNLQIVNGGQTTASIFNSNKNNKIDISKIYIQVKLTVIPTGKTEEIVPKISEYANTQNKVNPADFFSNHPFHLRIEEISRRLWAPSSARSLKDSHWYYERVSGQYANAQSNLTETQKKEFQIINPRKQMFNKTDLAKFEISWARFPHIVCLGAQKNFVKFAENISKSWSLTENEVNDLYFKKLIAKAIIFRTVDQLVLKQSWYGGLKAQIVTYTIAKASQMIEDEMLTFNLEKVWNEQAVSFNMSKLFVKIAEKINIEIQHPPSGITNFPEWCKKELCWDNVQRIPIKLPEKEIADDLISNVDQQLLDREAKDIRIIDNGIQAQKYVLEKGAIFWMKIMAWPKTKKLFSMKENGSLVIASQIPLKIPSEKQSLMLIDIELKAKKEGFKE